MSDQEKKGGTSRKMGTDSQGGPKSETAQDLTAPGPVTRQMKNLAREAFQTMPDPLGEEDLHLFSAEGSVQALMNPGQCRSGYEIFSRFGREKDEKKLKDKLAGLLFRLDMAEEKNAPDSYRRKVDRWLKEQKPPMMERETAISLAFGLELSYLEAERFLAFLAQDGLHFRSPSDLPYLFLLSHQEAYQKMDGCERYQKAVVLEKKLKKVLEAELKRLAAQQAASETPLPQAPPLFTQDMAAELEAYLRKEGLFGTRDSRKLEKALLDFVQGNATQFGENHRTARSYFDERVQKLTEPGGKVVRKDILETYCFSHLVPRRLRTLLAKDKGIDQHLKNILLNVGSFWPDRNTFGEMIAGKAEVTRKTFLLVSLTSGVYEFGQEEEDEDEDEFDSLYGEISTEDEVDARLRRMDGELTICGFHPLDMRNPFDWMIAHIITATTYVDMEGRSIDEDQFSEDFLNKMLLEIYKPFRVADQQPAGEDPSKAGEETVKEDGSPGEG